MKKFLSSILILATTFFPFLATAQLMIPQGGTGLATAPAGSIFIVSDAFRTTASSSPSFARLYATSTLQVTGAVSFLSTLAVTGATTLTGNLIFTNFTFVSATQGSTTIPTNLTVGAIYATSTARFAGAVTMDSTLGVTGTSTIAGLSAGFGTFSENLVASKLLNVTGIATFSANIIAAGGMTLTCTDCITNANVSDTLTASDLVAGSSVVSNAEVDNDLTISGGVIDNTVIGGTTAAAGTFTNLTATASSTIRNLWVNSSATTSSLVVRGNFATAIGSTTGATTQTIDWNTGPTQRIILQGNTTIVMNSTSSNPIDGGRYVVKLIQDSTGSRTVNWATPESIRWWRGTTTVSATANTCTWIGFIYESRASFYTALASSTPVSAGSC